MLNRQNNRVYNCTLNSFGSTLMICLNVSPSSNPEEPQKPNRVKKKKKVKSLVVMEPWIRNVSCPFRVYYFPGDFWLKIYSLFSFSAFHLWRKLWIRNAGSFLLEEPRGQGPPFENLLNKKKCQFWKFHSFLVIYFVILTTNEVPKEVTF